VILETLGRTGGNITRAAHLLGVERGTLRYKMKKHGIDGQKLKKKLITGEFEPVSVTD
jgi:DNA-binding NtrC family response regulator